MMMRIFTIILMLGFGMMAEGKSTYIPKYKSYIHIVNGADTIVVSNSQEDLSLSEASGLFSIRIEHEIVTQEKVKAIKRAKRAAGWMEFSAVMSGMSTAFSNNSLQYMVRSTTTYLTAQLADIYAANAKAEEVLDLYVWIDNKSDGEIMVNDMDRGLIWCILPRQSLKLKLNNPEASRLRISDPKNDFVRYANVMAGSSITKWDVAWEDEDCWICCVYKEETYSHDEFLSHYIKISKADYSEEEMSVKEFNAFKKRQK